MLMAVAVIPKTTLVIIPVELDEAEEDMPMGAISAVRRRRKTRLHSMLSDEETVEWVLELRQPFCSESQLY